MEKLRKMFSNISLAFKDIYRTYPITIIVVYITTLIYAFGTSHFLNEFNKNDGLMVMTVWAIGTFFVENWFSKKSVKIIGYNVFRNVTLYCEITKKPSGWDKDFAFDNCTVYWGGTWEYVDGVPQPIVSNAK